MKMAKTNYRIVAKKLGVKYLFSRWGISLYWQAPDGPKHWRPRLVPLDGWLFNEQDIINAVADDPDLTVSYGTMARTSDLGRHKGEKEQ